MSSTAFPLKVQ